MSDLRLDDREGLTLDAHMVDAPAPDLSASRWRTLNVLGTGCQSWVRVL